MNVFVLNAGRCGSTTFAIACSHITNFTSGHETRVRKIGADRFAYPDNHIDADHYLSWMLGRLDEAYGEDAMYVHLTRDVEACAHSWSKTKPYWMGSPATAYRHAFLMMTREYSFIDTCRDFVNTANTNIRSFLRDKPHQMNFAVETARRDWEAFWGWIGAEGDYEAALAEWSTPHNSSIPSWSRPIRNARDRAHKIFWALTIR